MTKLGLATVNSAKMVGCNRYCTSTILHMNICWPQMLLVNHGEQNKMGEHFSPAYACWTGESPLALLISRFFKHW